MEIKVLNVDGRRLVATSLNEGRIALADYESQTLLGDIRLPACSGMLFDISPDARVLATGYSYFRGVDLWDISSGKKLEHLNSNDMAGVLFSGDGKFLVVATTGTSYVRRLSDGVQKGFKHCDDVRAAGRDRAGNVVLLPTNRREAVVKVDFNAFAVETIHFPIKRTISWIRWSPVDDTFVVSDMSNRKVRYYAGIGAQPVWERKMAGVCCVAVYSGNGELLAVQVSPDSGPYIMEVLDPKTGETLRSFEARGAEFPFDDTTVITHDGRIIDLETGQISERVSKAAWWRKCGVQDSNR